MIFTVADLFLKLAITISALNAMKAFLGFDKRMVISGVEGW